MDKYRIIKIKNPQFHYALQKRFLFFWWKDVNVFISYSQASKALRRIEGEDALWR